MFQKINRKINYRFELDIPKGRKEIVALLRQKAIEQSSFSFFVTVDFKEIKFLKEGIEIIRAPGTFSPSRPFGKIKMTFTEGGPTLTKLSCIVMPGNDSTPTMLVIQTVILTIWSIGWIVAGWRLDPLTRYLTPLGVVVIVAGIAFLKYRINRRDLIDYSRSVVKLMRE